MKIRGTNAICSLAIFGFFLKCVFLHAQYDGALKKSRSNFFWKLKSKYFSENRVFKFKISKTDILKICIFKSFVFYDQYFEEISSILLYLITFKVIVNKPRKTIFIISIRLYT